MPLGRPIDMDDRRGSVDLPTSTRMALKMYATASLASSASLNPHFEKTFSSGRRESVSRSLHSILTITSWETFSILANSSVPGEILPYSGFSEMYAMTLDVIESSRPRKAMMSGSVGSDFMV